MSQSLHFHRIKCFDAKVIQSFDIETILRMLKAGLGQEKSNIDETTYDLFFEPIEEITISLSANDPKLEKLLGTGAKNLLHPNSRYYLVTEELSKVINEMSWKLAISELKSSTQSQETCKEYFKDCAMLKIWYNQKILMVEAS
ncbi:hypothetical protein H6S82_31895 [Planktothrix sp. FACHB-1355]|uniref:Uncharacterized protein n=1 Tax=Aerosakkonema funiforme FACHB-1375 TaxID=2949571 RepID=A0A926ZG59_9CYAN|nr:MULTISPECIES: hypothetical protein [Oscillatoriales]MBD2181374.1 hypothetical protein [Aerosakkonema funiforme FACHB-1375]MBD3563408.1 hypothetical protein [Planktothrix sp. FACHB-1355]